MSAALASKTKLTIKSWSGSKQPGSYREFMRDVRRCATLNKCSKAINFKCEAECAAMHEARNKFIAAGNTAAEPTPGITTLQLVHARVGPQRQQPFFNI